MDAGRRSTSASRPATEIENLKDLDTALASGQPLTGLRLQDLDLTAYEAPLLTRTDVEGLVVLGGRLPPALDAHLRAHRALIFPTDPAAPVDPYRATLYSPEELYAGLAEHGYEATPDFLAYQWMLDAAVHRDAFVTLLRAIHDDSMTDALDELTEGRRVVGVMGGHDAGPRHERLRRGGPSGPRPGERRARGRDGRRSGGHGGREPRSAGRRPGTLDSALGPPGHGSDVPAVGARLGDAAPSRCAGSWSRAARRAASASRRGSTATSRRTSSATASASTSPTRSVRTGCWPGPPPGSSCSRELPARSRRSSRR